MPNHPHCLNCNEPISKVFCPHCGQKTATHRITFKHFIFHDLLHGVWHLEKGILFTLKEAFVRPGQAALDYISGKRVRYYNVFYLSLLMIGLHFLLLHFYGNFNDETVKSTVPENGPNFNKFFNENAKFIFFSIVPVLALNSYLFFRRLQLNLAEHLIIAGICLLGMLEVTILFSFFNFLNEKNTLGKILGIFEVIAFFGIILYPIWVYSNALKKVYSNWSFLWRIVLFYTFVLLQIVIILSLILHQLSNGETVYINL